MTLHTYSHATYSQLLSLLKAAGCRVRVLRGDGFVIEIIS